MGEFKLRPYDTASLRLRRLDNGSVRFSVFSEPDATRIAFVDLSPADTDDIIEIIKRLRSEPLA